MRQFSAQLEEPLVISVIPTEKCRDLFHRHMPGRDCSLVLHQRDRSRPHFLRKVFFQILLFIENHQEDETDHQEPSTPIDHGSYG